MIGLIHEGMFRLFVVGTDTASGGVSIKIAATSRSNTLKSGAKRLVSTAKSAT
jgi:hypothetical protein